MKDYKKKDERNSYLFMLIAALLSSLMFFLKTIILLKVLLFIFLSWKIFDIFVYLYKRIYSNNLDVSNLKILDSSAIIDGRIMEIVNANFMEGAIVIPSFILRELHRLADSDSALKRAKGRRALDLIDELVKDKKVNVYIETKDYTFTTDVDTKIITFAKEKNAKIITTDYNMSKVAKIHGLVIMNINKLANVMKSILLPEEEIEVDLLKKGDKANQAIGYLEDGTMIIVENGSTKVGEKVRAFVTSTYPTPAGKMIFAKIRTQSNDSKIPREINRAGSNEDNKTS